MNEATENTFTLTAADWGLENPVDFDLLLFVEFDDEGDE